MTIFFALHNGGAYGGTISYHVTESAPDGCDVSYSPTDMAIEPGEFEALQVDIIAPSSISEYPTIDIIEHDETAGIWDDLSQLVLEAE